MGFSDEIEVAMIAINKATILEITGDDRIAIPMTFGNIRRAIAATKSTETCAARSELRFCFVLPFWFSRFRRRCRRRRGWSSSLVITQDNSWYATIYFVENNADLMENAPRKRRSKVPFSP